MKATAILTLVLTAMFCTTLGVRSAWAAEKKILVAYFSHSGNTEAVAKQIHDRVGGDLLEIRTVGVYPAEYHECTEYAKKKQEENARPELSTKVSDMGAYDVVFIGYPIWWGTVPMGLFTFFEQYDFSGKTIAPFCTHGGSGVARSAADIATLCPQATVLDALAVRGASAGSAQNEVASWLQRVGMGN